MVKSFEDLFLKDQNTVLNRVLYDEAKEDTSSTEQLSDKGILREVIKETIIIEPFQLSHLQDVGYDFTLAKHFKRQITVHKPWYGMVLALWAYLGMGWQGWPISLIFLLHAWCMYTLYHNIWSRHEVINLTWKDEEAKPASYYRTSWIAWFHSENLRMNYDESIQDNDLMVWIHPNELLLGLTNEVIGIHPNHPSKQNFMMQMSARSQIGRSGLTVCRCANAGSSFNGRWVLEITCTSNLKVPLVVGRRYGSISFRQVGPSFASRTPTMSQFSQGIHPTMQESIDFMLPRLYND